MLGKSNERRIFENPTLRTQHRNLDIDMLSVGVLRIRHLVPINKVSGLVCWASVCGKPVEKEIHIDFSECRVLNGESNIDMLSVGFLKIRHLVHNNEMSDLIFWVSDFGKPTLNKTSDLSKPHKFSHMLFNSRVSGWHNEVSMCQTQGWVGHLVVFFPSEG